MATRVRGAADEVADWAEAGKVVVREETAGDPRQVARVVASERC